MVQFDRVRSVALSATLLLACAVLNGGFYPAWADEPTASSESTEAGESGALRPPLDPSGNPAGPASLPSSSHTAGSPSGHEPTGHMMPADQDLNRPAQTQLLKSGTVRSGQSNDSAPASVLKTLDKPVDIDAPLSTLTLGNVDIKASLAPDVRKFKTVYITVSNRTQLPLIFDGEHAKLLRIENDAAPIACVPQSVIDAIGHPPTTFKQKLLMDTKDTFLAGITVGAIPTANTFKQQFGPILDRYGYDEARREREEEMFGSRILYPGDTSSGNIYFKSNALAEGMTLSFPVKSFYKQSNQTSVTAKIQGVVQAEAIKPSSERSTKIYSATPRD